MERLKKLCKKKFSYRLDITDYFSSHFYCSCYTAVFINKNFYRLLLDGAFLSSLSLCVIINTKLLHVNQPMKSALLLWSTHKTQEIIKPEILMTAIIVIKTMRS